MTDTPPSDETHRRIKEIKIEIGDSVDRICVEANRLGLVGVRVSAVTVESYDDRNKIALAVLWVER